MTTVTLHVLNSIHDNNHKANIIESQRKKRNKKETINSGKHRLDKIWHLCYSLFIFPRISRSIGCRSVGTQRWILSSVITSKIDDRLLSNVSWTVRGVRGYSLRASFEASDRKVSRVGIWSSRGAIIGEARRWNSLDGSLLRISFWPFNIPRYAQYAGLCGVVVPRAVFRATLPLTLCAKSVPRLGSTFPSNMSAVVFTLVTFSTNREDSATWTIRDTGKEPIPRRWKSPIFFDTRDHSSLVRILCEASFFFLFYLFLYSFHCFFIFVFLYFGVNGYKLLVNKNRKNIEILQNLSSIIG